MEKTIAQFDALKHGDIKTFDRIQDELDFIAGSILQNCLDINRSEINQMSDEEYAYVFSSVVGWSKVQSTDRS